MTANLVDKASFSRPLLLYNRTRQTAMDHGDRVGNSRAAASLSEAVFQADIV